MKKRHELLYRNIHNINGKGKILFLIFDVLLHAKEGITNGTQIQKSLFKKTKFFQNYLRKLNQIYLPFYIVF